MIDRLAEKRWPVTAVLCDEKFTKQADARNLKLKDNQWSLIDELLPVLKVVVLFIYNIGYTELDGAVSDDMTVVATCSGK